MGGLRIAIESEDLVTDVLRFLRFSLESIFFFFLFLLIMFFFISLFLGLGWMGYRIAANFLLVTEIFSHRIHC
jgi:hypothetical protein